MQFAPLQQDIIDLTKLFAFVWLGCWAAVATYRIVRGERRSVYFALLVLFGFFALPLALDLILGLPKYRWAGFISARDSFAANIAYSAYISWVPVVLWAVGRPRVKNVDYRFTLASLSDAPRWVPIVAATATLCSFIPLLLSPDLSVYRVYAAATLGLISDPEHHAIVAAFAGVAILSSAMVVATSDRLWVSFLMVLPLLFVSNWVIGKRFSVAVTLLVFTTVFWLRGALRGRRLVYLAMALGTGLLVYSFAYQSVIRGKVATTSAWEDAYAGFRTDYGRDDVLRMELFAEMYPERMRILEHRGQSALFSVAFWVPRSAWSDKPMPYAQYVTSAMIGTPPRFWGWSMTTSVLGEAVANFGWFGIFIGPLLVGLVCRVGDSSRSRIAQLLTPLVACLFLVVQLIAFMPVFLLWAFLIARSASSRKLARLLVANPRVQHR